MLHILIQIFFHVGRPGRSQKAAIAERARPEFGGAVKPSDDFPGAEQLNGFFHLLVVVWVKSESRLAIFQNLLDFLIRVCRSPIESCNRVLPGTAVHVVAHIPGGAQRCPFIPSRGLNKNTIEPGVFFHMRNRDRIQKQSSRKA